jgi:hypothetical protein
MYHFVPRFVMLYSYVNYRFCEVLFCNYLFYDVSFCYVPSCALTEHTMEQIPFFFPQVKFHFSLAKNGIVLRACNLTSFSPCLTGPVDYLFASRHKGPGLKSPGGYLCEIGILLLLLSRYIGDPDVIDHHCSLVCGRHPLQTHFWRLSENAARRYQSRLR